MIEVLTSFHTQDRGSTDPRTPVLAYNCPDRALCVRTPRSDELQYEIVS